MRPATRSLALLLAALAAAGACTGAPPDGARRDTTAADAPAPGDIIGHDSVLGPGDTTGVRELPPGTVSRDSAARDTLSAADSSSSR